MKGESEHRKGKPIFFKKGISSENIGDSLLKAATTQNEPLNPSPYQTAFQGAEETLQKQQDRTVFNELRCREKPQKLQVHLYNEI